MDLFVNVVTFAMGLVALVLGGKVIFESGNFEEVFLGVFMVACGVFVMHLPFTRNDL